MSTDNDTKQDGAKKAEPAVEVTTYVTVHRKSAPTADVEVLPPGEHKLPESEAAGLISSGNAELTKDVRARSSEDPEGVKVTTKGASTKGTQK